MITIFFWPFMIVAIFLSLLGWLIKKPILLYIASILILPMSLYLAVTPLFIGWGLIFPLLLIGSGSMIKRGKIRIAVLMSLPVYILIGGIGFVVLTQ